jgi:hypothetical protein
LAQTATPLAVATSVDTPESQARSTLLPTLKTILERLASGSDRRLDPLVEAFKEAFVDGRRPGEAYEPVSSEVLREWREYFGRVEGFVGRLRRAGGGHGQGQEPLVDGGDDGGTGEEDWETWLKSGEFKNEIHALIKRGEELVSSAFDHRHSDKDTGKENPIKRFFRLLIEFVDAVRKDHTTIHLIDAMRNLVSALTDYLSPSPSDSSPTSASRTNWWLDQTASLTQALWRDLRTYFIPRLLNGVLKSVLVANKAGYPLPLPRVEVKTGGSGAVDVAIEGRGMRVFYDPGGGTSDEDSEKAGWYGWLCGCCGGGAGAASGGANADGMQVQVEEEADVVEEDEDGLQIVDYYDSPIIKDKGVRAVTEFVLPTSIQVHKTSETHIDMSVEEADERTPLLSQAAAATLLPTTSIPDSAGMQTRTRERTTVHLNSLFAYPVSPPSHRHHSPSESHAVMKPRVLSLDGILYYFNYKGVVFYSDEGSFDVDIVVEEGSEGVSLEVVLEVDSTTTPPASDASQHSLFTVPTVRLSLPSSIHVNPLIMKSKHGIINSTLTQPIVLPILETWGRKKLEEVVEGYVKEKLEGLGRFLGGWFDGAKKKSEEDKKGAGGGGVPGIRHWWSSLEDEISHLIHPQPQPAATTAYEPTLSARGVQVRFVDLSDPRDTTSHGEGEAPSLTSGPAHEDGGTVVAVGLAPQLIPDHAVPSFPSAREVIDEVEEAAEEVVEGMVDEAGRGVEEGVRRARKIGEEVGEGVERGFERAGEVREEYDLRRKVEHVRGGWRSGAFDL